MMNEIELIEKITPFFKQSREVIVGPGDDCAVLEGSRGVMQLFAADQLVEHVHYDSKTTSPPEIAVKLLKRNISDIAAMGGEPSSAVVTVATCGHDDKWFTSFYRALAREAEIWGVSVCGGDIASLKSVKGASDVATLSILGNVKKQKLCLRSNANAGDIICVTGSFGNSYASGHHIAFTPRLKESAFLAGRFTNAMIDVSDGLLIDLTRMSKASSCGAVLNVDEIPLRAGADVAMALGDGEDYELIFAVKPELFDTLGAEWTFDTPMTGIGFFTDTAPEIIRGIDGRNLCDIYRSGYNHFNNSEALDGESTEE